MLAGGIARVQHVVEAGGIEDLHHLRAAGPLRHALAARALRVVQSGEVGQQRIGGV